MASLVGRKTWPSKRSFCTKISAKYRHDAGANGACELKSISLKYSSSKSFVLSVDLQLHFRAKKSVA